MNTKKRFSKAGLIFDLESQEKRLRQQYGFSPSNGWAQVEKADIVQIVDYGRWTAIRDLLQDLYDGRK